MTMKDSIFPQWIEGRFVSDTALQRAYERVSAVERSWLKTCIAQLHSVYGQSDTGSRCVETIHSQAYHSLFSTRPMSWSLVILDGSMASGPRSLAAILPPLLAGVQDVLIVRAAPSKSPWPHAMLAGIELAGVEQCAQLGQRALNELLLHLVAPEQALHGPGLIIMPQPVALIRRDVLLHLAEAPHCNLWRSGWSGEIGVYPEEIEWDMEALTWAQPDAVIRCHAPESYSGLAVFNGVLPQTLALATPDRGAFLARHYAWAFAPRTMHKEVLEHGCLALGEGEEGCWLWPGLSPDIFVRFAAGVSRPILENAGEDAHQPPFDEEQA